MAALRCSVNAAQDGFGTPSGDEIWRDGEAEGARLGPWAVRWSVQGAG